MTYHKMGDGPFYAFYTPYHLCNFEAPLTAARAVLFGDATIAPAGAPVCEVMTVAKRDLRAGEELDGIGGFTCYGVLIIVTSFTPVATFRWAWRRDVVSSATYGRTTLSRMRMSRFRRDDTSTRCGRSRRCCSPPSRRRKPPRCLRGARVVAVSGATRKSFQNNSKVPSWIFPRAQQQMGTAKRKSTRRFVSAEGLLLAPANRACAHRDS